MASPRGAALQLGGCRSVTDPAGCGRPPASSPGCGVCASLGESHCPQSCHPPSSDVVSEQRLLPVVPGVPRAGDHAQRCNTWRKGKEGRVKEDKRFNKKCSPVTVLDVASIAPNPYSSSCACVAGVRQDGKGRSWAGREVCVCESDSEKLGDWQEGTTPLAAVYHQNENYRGTSNPTQGGIIASTSARLWGLLQSTTSNQLEFGCPE